MSVVVSEESEEISETVISSELFPVRSDLLQETMEAKTKAAIAIENAEFFITEFFWFVYSNFRRYIL
jgi:hypothetical protein